MPSQLESSQSSMGPAQSLQVQAPRDVFLLSSQVSRSLQLQVRNRWEAKGLMLQLLKAAAV